MKERVMKKLCVLILFCTQYLPSVLLGQDEGFISQQLFRSSYDISDFTTEAISDAVDAVWLASELTNAETTSGTLTQSNNNPDVWSYSASPTGKLVVVFANGQRIEFVFSVMTGYTDGTADDFKESHQMDYTIVVPGQVNLRIQSNTWWENGQIKWQRTCTGDILYETEMMSVNINFSGHDQYDIGGSISLFDHFDQASGTSLSGSASLTINEAYAVSIAHNSNSGIFSKNTEIWNNSTTVVGNTTYQYQNAHVFWAAGTQFPDSANAGVYNRVIDAYQWVVEGQMLKNNQVYGAVQFDGPVIDGTMGPYLVLHLGTGADYLLHTLIRPMITSVHQTETPPADFALSQNYPNPFNPATTIRFSVPSTSKVNIAIFDALGQEVDVLVDAQYPQGTYQVQFDAGNLANGLYLYRMQAGAFTQTRKLLVLK